MQNALASSAVCQPVSLSVVSRVFRPLMLLKVLFRVDLPLSLVDPFCPCSSGPTGDLPLDIPEGTPPCLNSFSARVLQPASQPCLALDAHRHVGSLGVRLMVYGHAAS